jgi:hypothetical protein
MSKSSTEYLFYQIRLAQRTRQSPPDQDEIRSAAWYNNLY